MLQAWRDRLRAERRRRDCVAALDLIEEAADELCDFAAFLAEPEKVVGLAPPTPGALRRLAGDLVEAIEVLEGGG
jgi:hypothetical protein